MLVLSRKPNEKILFPGLDIAVQVVSVNKSCVRIGINAPAQVAVIREELQDRANVPAPKPSEGLARLIGNRLRIASASLTQLRDVVSTGTPEELRDMIDRLQEDLELLRRRVALPSHLPQPAPRVQVRIVEHDLPSERVAVAVARADAVGVRG